MHSKKLKRFLAKKFVELAGIFFALLFMLAGIVYAYTTWAPGGPPQAAPSEGNVKLSWTNDGTNVYRVSGNVGIGTMNPEAKFHVEGDIKIGNSSATCNATTEGSIRYNSTAKDLEFCDGSDWMTAGSSDDGSSGGGTPPPTYLVNSQHTENQCTALGGTVYDNGTNTFCRLSGASCTTYGWAQLNNWSTTANTTCTLSSSCRTGSHPFSNKVVESCQYFLRIPGCTSGMCNDIKQYNTCYATRTEVGCY